MKKPFKAAKDPEYPAVVLLNPMFPHNVGAAVRAASCYDVKQVWITGSRVPEKVWEGKRLPREERMKGFSDVDLILDQYPFKKMKNATPVAVELLPGAENLYQFEHPENPVYVFGPEDGTILPTISQHCHRRVYIPTRHCTNLAAAVYLILNDRKYKRYKQGIEDLEVIEESLAGEGRNWPVQGRIDSHVWDIAVA